MSAFATASNFTHGDRSVLPISTREDTTSSRSARTGLVCFAAVVFLMGATQSAQAATIAFAFNDPSSGAASAQGNDGFRFQPTAAIQVTSLGYYDRNQDGLTLNHQVGIYDFLTQTLLASTTVGAGSTLDGLFRYNAITPLTLNAGQSYMVVGFHPGSTTQDLAASNPTGFTTAAPLTYQGYFLNYNSSLSFPTTNGSGTFFGPNFQFQPADAAVPEPSTFALFGIVLAFGVGCYFYRRQRSLASIA